MKLVFCFPRTFLGSYQLLLTLIRLPKITLTANILTVATILQSNRANATASQLKPFWHIWLLVEAINVSSEILHFSP